MGRIVIVGAERDGALVTRLEVRFEGLSRRIVPRDTVIAWMRDGHSVLPAASGAPTGTGRALQLVDVDGVAFLRDDHATEAADSLPELPSITG